MQRTSANLGQSQASTTLNANEQKRRLAMQRLRQAAGGVVERLEKRQLLSVNTAWVNDNWVLAVDNNENGVAEQYDIVTTTDAGPVTGLAYGVQAFGKVTSSSTDDTFVGHVAGYESINVAIANTNTNGTVRLLSGTYMETVAINKNLTLRGSGDNTVIQAPATYTPGVDNVDGIDYPIVMAKNAANVQLRDLKIDGNGAGNGFPTWFDGIGYFNAGGTVDNVTVTGIRNNPLDGMQDGIGIVAIVDDSNARTLNVNNSRIEDFQKSGLYANGQNLTVNLTGNTITGIGATNIIAQNGMELVNGVSGSVTGNTIKDLAYTGGGWDSTGIYLNSSGVVTITNNSINSTDVAIDAADSAALITVAGNNFNGASNAADNKVDLLIESTATNVAIGAGNLFGGKDAFIHNDSSTGYNLVAYPDAGFEGLTDPFAIEDRMHHAIDKAGAGLVTWDANTIYVTPAASASATNNDFTRIANAVNAAQNDWTVKLGANLGGDKVFNWDQSNALASWELGNDALAGTTDDWSINLTQNLSNFTITADDNTVTVQGPGDVASTAWDTGFLGYDTGANTDITFSNFTITGIANAIGLFHTGGANYSGLTIENMHIVVPSDDDSDGFHNIGIHYALGQNIRLINNTIDFEGTGTGDAVSVGIQSNTHGGTNYDGLEISDNTFTVLNNGSERILGVWENGHAHGSDITVADNTFTNATNNSNTTAFRVTSHSGASSTVTYSGNTIDGASVGFDWLASYANTPQTYTDVQAVQLINNTVSNTGTAVNIGGIGAKANLVGNEFDANDIDVRIQAGSGTVGFGAGNLFGASDLFIKNESAQNINLTTYTAANFDGLSNNYRIEDKIHHKVDDSAVGKVTWVAGNVFVTTPASGSTDSDLNRGVAAADTGDTVNVESGTYQLSSAVNVNKAVSIVGQAAGTVTLTTASGFTGFTPLMQVGGGSLDNSSTVSIDKIDFNGNNTAAYGVLVSSSAVLDTLNVTNGSVSGMTFGGVAVHGASDNGLSVENVNLDNLSFSSNGADASGSGDVILFDFNGNASLINLTFVGSGSIANPAVARSRYAIQLRGSKYSTTITPSGTVVLDDIDVSGLYKNYGIIIQGYSDVNGLTLNDVALGGGSSALTGSFGALLRFDKVGVGSLASPAAVNLGNTLFRGITGANAYNQVFDLEIAPDNSTTFLRANATATQWVIGSNTVNAGATLSDANAFAIENRTQHCVDKLHPTHGAFKGFVQLKSGNVYVTDQANLNLAGDGSITRALEVASAGDTVRLSAGSFDENVSVGKSVTILGAGSANTTVSAASGAVVTLAANDITLTDLTLQSVAGRALTVNTGISIEDLMLDSVIVQGTNNLNNTEDPIGLYVAVGASINGLTVTDTAFKDLAYGWYFMKNPTGDTSNVSDVDVTDTAFTHNFAKGIYAEKLSDATFTDVTITNNGYWQNFFNANFNAGVDINLKFGNYQNIIFNNATVSGNAVFTDSTASPTPLQAGQGDTGLAGISDNGAGITIKARDDGGTYGANPATLTNVQINGGTFTNNQTAIRIGEVGKANATPTNTVIDGTTITASLDAGIILTGGSTTLENIDFDGAVDNAVDLRIAAGSQGLTLGDDIAFAGDSLFIDNRKNVDLDLTQNDITFDETNNFRIEDRMFHKVDDGSVGKVTWVADNVFVTNAGTDNSIQRGVNAADTGDTVNVEAGVFTESVNVNKSLTLKGAQAGVDARTRGLTVAEADESTLNASTGGFDVTTAGVTIDGFILEGGSTGAASGIRAFNASGDTFRNNIIRNNQFGILLNSPSGTLNVIERNYIHSNNQNGGAGGVGIATNSAAANNILIQENRFANHVTGAGNSAAINLLATSVGSTGVIIEDNTSSGDESFVAAFQTTGLVIQRNDVDAGAGSAIYLGGLNTGTQVLENDITGHTRGVAIANDFGQGANSNITVANNTLDGNTIGIRVGSGGLTGTLNVTENSLANSTTAGLRNDSSVAINAEANWWGQPAGPNVASNMVIGTKGSAIDGSGGALVDYSPWLTSGTDTSAAIGFQPTAVDTTAPAAPGTPDLQAVSDSKDADHGSDSDNLTASTTPAFDISYTGETPATLQLLVDGNVVASMLVNSAGTYSLSSTALVDGEYDITSRAIDAAGNVGAQSGVLSITIDTTSPDAPTAPDLVASSDSKDTNANPLIGSDSDNITKVKTPTFSGTAEAGSLIRLYSGSTQVGTAVTAGTGVWSVTTSPLAEGSHNITATATDEAGNVSSASSPITVVVVDSVPPAAPADLDLSTVSDTQDADTTNPSTIGSDSDNVTSINTPTITGTAENGSLVRLYANSVQVGTAFADSNGDWSITTAALTSGANAITATATDTAGNTSALSTALNITVDALAPAAPTQLDLAAASDSKDANLGSDSDDLTDDTTPTITGQAEAGSFIRLYANSTFIGSAVADGNGDWSITSTQTLADGNYAITATATDTAGNLSQASSALNIVIDNTNPAAPGTPDLVTADDSLDAGIGSNADNVTSEDQPTFTGTGEAGALIRLYADGNEIGTAIVANNNTWSVTATAALADGEYDITATATDAAGNVSAASSALSITIDTTDPAAPANLDLIAASDTLDSGIGTNADNITADNTPAFTGTGEAGALIRLYAGSTQIGTAVVDSNGDWSITSSQLADGSYAITATATDTAGNVSSASGALNVTIDTNAPSVPSTPDMVTADDTFDGTTTPVVGTNADNITSDNTPTFTGTADAGSLIRLYSGSTQIGSIVADSSGNWSIEASTLANGAHSITATATDTAGNVSGASGALSIHIDIAQPVVNAGSDQTVSEGALVSLAGSFTDVGSTGSHAYRWTITASNGQVIADSNAANYQFTPVDNGTYTATFFVTDSAGNTASDSTVVTVNNANPTAVAFTLPVSVNEASQATATVTGVTDAGSADTFTYSYVVKKNGNVFASSGGFISATSFNFTPDDSDPGMVWTVEVQARDDDGGLSPVNTQTLTVTDVLPQVFIEELTPSLNEGQSATLRFRLVDPGNGDLAAVAIVSINWGDGTSTIINSGADLTTLRAGNAVTLTHTYTDDPTVGTSSDTLPVTINVTQSDIGQTTNVALATGSEPSSVTVHNVAPTGVFVNTTPTVDAGSPVTVAWGAQSDPSSNDVASGFKYSYYVDYNNNSQVDAGELVIANTSASTLQIAGSYFNTAGTYTIRSTISDNDGGVTHRSASVQVNAVTFRVSTVTPTASGFEITFNRPFNASQINLYAQNKTTPADLTVTRNGTAVKGSLIFTAGSNKVLWVASNLLSSFNNVSQVILPDGTYTLTLRSAADGFADANGDLLDGDVNGSAGGNYVNTFTVANAGQRFLFLPDFTRGPGQVVQVPSTGPYSGDQPTTANLPIRINAGASVSTVYFELVYDSALITFDANTPLLSMPAGWAANTVVSDEALTGTLRKLTVDSFGPTVTTSGLTTLFSLNAVIPWNATYGSSQALQLQNVEIDGIGALGDTAVHVYAYVGDVNGSGVGRAAGTATDGSVYSGADSLFMQNVSVGNFTGFNFYNDLDPTVVGDVNNSGTVTGADGLLVQQRGTNPAGTALIPPTPEKPAQVAPMSAMVMPLAGTSLMSNTQITYTNLGVSETESSKKSDSAVTLPLSAKQSQPVQISQSPTVFSTTPIKAARR